MISKEEAVKNLLEVRKALFSVGVRFILDGGTLLGLYRDGMFPEDDQDDIDLTLWHDVVDSKETDILLSMGKMGFGLFKVREGPTKILKFSKRGGRVDLIFKKVKEDWAYWVVRNKEDQIVQKVPAHFYMYTQEKEYFGKRFLIPREIEDYLTYRYDDWKTPIHRSEWNYVKDDGATDPELSVK